MSTPLWEPDAARCATSNLARFMDILGPRTGRMFSSCDELHRYSVEEPESFWAELWEFAGVKGEKGDRPWLIDAERMPGARFFPRGRLNYAENALSRRGPDAALVFWGEDKVKARMSWDALREEVARFQGFSHETLASAPTIAWRPCCPICRSSLWGCSARPHWVPCGPPVRPILACKASSTASARSRRRC